MGENGEWRFLRTEDAPQAIYRSFSRDTVDPLFLNTIRLFTSLCYLIGFGCALHARASH